MRYVAIGLLISVAVALMLHSPAAGALSLPDIANVNLPISSTPLDKIVSPITDQTNKLLPVNINSTPDTLSAKVALPTSSGQSAAPVLDASVSVPVVPNVVNSLTNPSAPPVSSSSTPNQPVLRTSLLPTLLQISVPSSTNNTPSIQTASATRSPSAKPDSASTAVARLNQEGEQDNLAMPLTPVFVGVAKFLGDGMPMGISSLTNNLTNNNVGITPVLISAALFVVMAVLIIGSVYVIDHTSLINLGGGRLAQFARMHDLTQIAAVSVAIVGAIAVTVFLLVF